MRRAQLAAVAALLLAAAAARASEPIGVYALIDKVVFEPSEDRPERVQRWGRFGTYRGKGHPPTERARGSLYYALPKNKPDVARKEWADLKKVAGTGVVVGFGVPGTAGGLVRRPAQQREPGAPADAAKIDKLIAD